MREERITMRDVREYKREVLDQTVLVTPAVAAEILSVSERTVRRLVRDGEITGYARQRGSRGLRILARELKEYVDSIRVERESWIE